MKPSETHTSGSFFMSDHTRALASYDVSPSCCWGKHIIASIRIAVSHGITPTRYSARVPPKSHAKAARTRNTARTTTLS